jgi:hypothetical protein
VPPLSLPAADADLESLAASEAVQMLVERIRLLEPRFVVTERQAAAVTSICTQLDGILLALELAAGRAHSLSIDEINVRLKDRFKLLTGGSRSALPRQQTLRATLDWSYELLAENERSVFNRLAIFSGGFTLTVVASDETIDEFAVSTSRQTVARSLVVADEPHGEPIPAARNDADLRLGQAHRGRRGSAHCPPPRAALLRHVRSRGRRLDGHAGCGLARDVPARARQRARGAQLGHSSGNRAIGIALARVGTDVDGDVALR